MHGKAIHPVSCLRLTSNHAVAKRHCDGNVGRLLRRKVGRLGRVQIVQGHTRVTRRSRQVPLSVARVETVNMG